MGRRREAKLTLSVELDRRDLQNADRGIDSLQRTLRETEQVTDRTSDAFDAFGERINQTTRSIKQQNEVIQQRNRLLKGGLPGVRPVAGGSTAGLTGGRDIGAVGGGFGAISTLAGSIGARGLGEATGIADDILTVAENLPRMAEGLGLVNTGLTGTTAAASGAAPAVGGLAASTGALLAVAAPVAIALAAVAAAFKQFVDDINEQKDRVDDAIDAQRLYYETIETGTEESIRGQIAELEQQQRVAQQLRRDIAGATEALGILGKVIRSLTGTKDNIEELDREIQQTELQIGSLTRALENEQVQRRSVQSTQDETNRTLQEAIQSTQESTQATTQATQAENKRTEAIKRNTNVQRQSLGQIAQQNVLGRRQLEAEGQRAINEVVEEGIEERNALIRDEQRDEARFLRQHRQALQDIRDRADDAEFEALLDRDFAAVQRIRRDETRQLSRTVRDAEAVATERRISLTQRLQDATLRAEERLAQVRLEAARALAQFQAQAIQRALAFSFSRPNSNVTNTTFNTSVRGFSGQSSSQMQQMINNSIARFANRSVR